MTEIFVEPELENLQEAENAEQWYALCVELDLEKQANLASGSKEMKAPPYMYLDPNTEKIIKLICPIGTLYTEYNTSTIPLDVLQEIKKCIDNKWYERILIFHDNKSPDPFVVGEYQTGDNSWQKTRHLIARWGAELLPFEELERKAITRMKDAIMPELSEMKSKMEYALQNPELFIKQILGGKSAPNLNIHVPGLDTTWNLPF